MSETSAEVDVNSTVEVDVDFKLIKNFKSFSYLKKEVSNDIKMLFKIDGLDPQIVGYGQRLARGI